MNPKLIKDHRIKTRDRFKVVFGEHETATFNQLKDALQALQDARDESLCFRPRNVESRGW
jgi:hypothetical protein